MSLRWWCAFGALCAGCYSPTLPLPPPTQPSEESAGTNLVHLHGGPGSVEANVIVIIENQDTTFSNTQRVTATLSDATGQWDATVFAVKNDDLRIWQELGNNQEGTSIDFIVQVN